MADYVQGTSPNKNEKYTYADYLTWSDEERWELINGIAYNMSPAPKTEHQRISGNLFIEIGNFLKDKPCQAFSAPFDVVMADDSVVQPDISVICDKNKIDEQGCKGAPDLVVEILSKSTAYKDETEKRLLYERSGVKEYWIINPDLPELVKFVLKGERFSKPIHLSIDEQLESSALPGFSVELREIFAAKA